MEAELASECEMLRENLVGSLQEEIVCRLESTLPEERVSMRRRKWTSLRPYLGKSIGLSKSVDSNYFDLTKVEGNPSRR